MGGKQLDKPQHSDPSSTAQSRSVPAGYVFRAKLILMLAGGCASPKFYPDSKHGNSPLRFHQKRSRSRREARGLKA
jgi:hypothetical protein